jgi:hypothetical protein
METIDEKVERKRIFWHRSRWCNYIGLTLGLLVAAPVFGMLFDRREPVHLYEGQFVPDQVLPGQSIVVVWEVDELRQGCDGVVERRILEKKTGKVHYFKREPTVYHLVGPAGGRQTFSRDFTLPQAITPGPAEYTTIGERWCNLLQKYIWPMEFRGPTIPFNVMENPVPIPPNAITLPPSIKLQDLEIKLKPKFKMKRRTPQ